MTPRDFFSRRWTRIWAISAVATALAGCGGSAKKADLAPKQEANQANAEEDQPEAPAKAIKKKLKLGPKMAAVAAVASPSTKRPDQWELEDLQAALKGMDPQFAFAVVLFGMRHSFDAKGAIGLDALTRQIAAMKDDAQVAVPFPSAAPQVAAVPGMKPLLGGLQQGAGILHPVAGASALPAGEDQPANSERSKGERKGKGRRRRE